MKETYTKPNTELKPLTIEDLKKVVLKIHKIPPLPKNRKTGWFERLMNKFGWYRQYELMIIDKQIFGYHSYFEPLHWEENNQ